MAAPDLSPSLALKRVNDGISDPLGLGKPSIALPGKRLPWEPNTRRVMMTGYIGVKTDQGMELEHRLVAAKHYGDLGDLTVKHLDGDGLNNAPANLGIFDGNQPVVLGLGGEAELDKKSKTKKKSKKAPPRSKPYAIIPIPDDHDVVRAHSPREAEKLAGEGFVAVALSRLTK